MCVTSMTFVCVGTDVASKIKVPGDKTDSFNNLITVNSKSMFLCWVNDTDLIEIARKFKNKRSTDINSIDIVIIKYVIDSTVRPLTIFAISLFKKVFFLIV